MSLCPICGSGTATSYPTNGDFISVDCPSCGPVCLSGTVAAMLPDMRLKERDLTVKLAHHFRRSGRRPKPLTSYDLSSILQRPLPRPREQADLLTRYIGEHTTGLGDAILVKHAIDGPLIGSRSPSAFEMVVDHLYESGLVQGPRGQFLNPDDNSATVALTFSGWDRFEEIRSGHISYRKAFMAMKFGNPELNQMLEQIFKPSAKRAGFELVKLDDTPAAGLIDNRMRAAIQAADFVVADLSHDNLGAYWEAGYAEGLGKPVIYTCEAAKFRDTKTHFDTNHHQTIIWNLDAPHQAGVELVATIRATLPHVAKMVDDESGS